MQQTSSLYKDLLASDNHWFETRLTIGDTGRLIDRLGNRISFGGTTILVDTSGADTGFDESMLMSMGAQFRVFSEDKPVVGSCVSGEISVKMLKPTGDIPRRARMSPYVRVTDGERHSEWIKKGVFYLDTRDQDDSGETVKWITLHGYDAMIFAEEDYPSSTLQWPARDIDVVREIASALSVSLDPRTVSAMTKGYRINLPFGYSQREVLSNIAAMYAGCFVMSDLGELRLIQLNTLPKETRYLIVGSGDRRAITFGGDRILV